MHKQRNFQLNIGSSSILLIFVVLSLIAFAVLSFVSANADYKLSNKVLLRTTSYYQACNQAEASLSNIDATLHSIYLNASDTDDYYYQAGGKTLSYTYPLSDIQTLSIELAILYPDSDSGPFYQINKWQIVTTNSLNYDESLHVITD